MKLKRNDGFTLIEVIVVAGIIAVLAGILVPIIFKEIDESKKTRALADTKSIMNAITVLKKDTGQWPITATCAAATTALSGLGNAPTVAGAGWDLSARDMYDNFLTRDDNACWPATWKGPYMATVTADPWGRMYLTNAPELLVETGPIWIISAGPDGVLDTPVAQDTVSGDDIGVRLR